MARTGNTTSGRSSVKKNTADTPKPANDDTVTMETENSAPETTQESMKTYQVKDTIDPNMYVPVRNGFNGKLIYKSNKSGERYVWDKFGDELDMELRELRNAKTSYKVFFENNWFMIDDPEVIAYLGVERYYKNALSYDEFDSLFGLKPEEIEEKIALLSKGQKASIAYRAKQLIKEGGIDSIKVINTLEKSLGIELIER